MSRAKDETLGTIHRLMAESILQRLQNGEPLTAAEINSIGKFLKDNGIEVAPQKNDTLNDIRSKLPFLPGQEDDEQLPA